MWVHFVGAGNMAASLVGGLLKTGFPVVSISASDPGESARQILHEKFGVAVWADNGKGASYADVIVLAVKPQHMRPVVEDLRGVFARRSALPVLLSIAAGITTASIQDWAGVPVPIVRSMPNTPALIGLGATGMFATESVNLEQKKLAENIMEAVGRVWWFPREQQLDAVTAISGSGPAYFFLFMEAVQQAGVELGLSEQVAAELVLQTALGAVTMANQSGEPLDRLRQQVTSPGGTTAAALEYMLAASIPEKITDAVKAAERRARELSREHG